jgi:hypothetical protein
MFERILLKSYEFAPNCFPTTLNSLTTGFIQDGQRKGCKRRNRYQTRIDASSTVNVIPEPDIPPGPSDFAGNVPLLSLL